MRKSDSMALKSTRRSRLIDRGIQMQGNGVLVAADCPRRKRCTARGGDGQGHCRPRSADVVLAAVCLKNLAIRSTPVKYPYLWYYLVVQEVY